MCTFPKFPGRNSILLDGVWQFHWLNGDTFPDEISPEKLSFPEIETVPGVFDVNINRYGERGVGVYRREVTVSGSGRHRLRIGGLGLAGKIFWDGREIGRTQLAWSTVDFDFNPGDAGVHELVIAVDNRFTPAATPIFSSNFDFYGYGGIFRSVTLMELPEARFERVRVKSSDLSGKVQLLFSCTGFPDGENRIGIAFDDGAQEIRSVTFKNGSGSTECTVPEPALWTPESPALHHVRLSAQEYLKN